MKKGIAPDGLILGRKLGPWGLVEEKLLGKVNDLCGNIQDLFLTYRILEKSLEESPEMFKELKYVVIDMFDYSYFNFKTPIFEEDYEQLSFREDVHEEILEFQISNLEKILKLLKENNSKIRVFCVLLPKWYEKEQCDLRVNEMWKPFFENVMEEFQNEYSFVKFLDFKNCELFSTNHDFYEKEFNFNYLGACNFTEYLALVLQKVYGLFREEEKNHKQAYMDVLLEPLLNSLNKGYLNEQTIGYFRCFQLFSLLWNIQQTGKGREVYLLIKKYIEKINIQKLKKQEKIIIGFIANYSSTWIGDELYHFFEENEGFEPYVFLISNRNGQSDEMIIKEYHENLSFFNKKNMRVVQTLDLQTGKQYTWEEVGIKPQVCIWLTPWIDLFDEHFYLLEYSLDVLHTYIPYGFMLAENENNNFVEHQYNQAIHNLTWCNFEDSNYAMRMAEKYAFMGAENAVFTGYPKMDAFFKEDAKNSKEWELLVQKSGLESPKKIIYAPHHTLDGAEPVNFSTFASNYRMMLSLAEQYQDEIVWVFKPHPQLKYKAIRFGLFNDLDEWDEYVNCWKQLKNAIVVEEGEYQGLFVESDAMILDSVSFLAEYLYAHKPLLFLCGNKQRFNEFGRELIKIHYSADGSDEKSIRTFIQKVVLEGNDEGLINRDSFFDENLNYFGMKGKKASQAIYEWFCHELERDQTFFRSSNES